MTFQKGKGGMRKYLHEKGVLGMETSWCKGSSALGELLGRHLGQPLFDLGEVTLPPESAQWETMGCSGSLPILNLSSLTLTLVLFENI